MLRTALLLALLCLAHGGKLHGKGGGKDSGEVAAAGDLPSSITSDEDVRKIFHFMVENGQNFASDVRQEIPEAKDILTAEDPEAALGQVLDGVGKAFRRGMENSGKVLHALGLLSEAIFKHQMSFKRFPGGCESLYTLSQNFDIADKKEAARAAAVALSDDLYCMANDADVAESAAASIDSFNSADITAFDALMIVGGIAHGIVKSSEDGFKVFEGAFKVLGSIDPALQGQLHAALMDKPSREEEVTRLLRTLLKELNRRK